MDCDFIHNQMAMSEWMAEASIRHVSPLMGANDALVSVRLKAARTPQDYRTEHRGAAQNDLTKPQH